MAGTEGTNFVSAGEDLQTKFGFGWKIARQVLPKLWKKN